MNESSDNITPRWLKTKDAVRYSSIGKNRLKMLALQGKIKGAPDPDNKRGDWIFDRYSLDAYRESQTDTVTIREKALAIMKGVRI